ncbi:MAG: DUF3445 domain-containing protein [Verrucomicrobia bacterium]|nr:MAG: DUF3445 domain-containing protein [Verrucomicrobiota bacterium]
MTLAELFPDDDYKFQLRFERGSPADFFAPTARHAELIAERKHWLRAEPEKYSALLASGAALLTEALELAREWSGFGAAASDPAGWSSSFSLSGGTLKRELQRKRAGSETGAPPTSELLALGEFWEADSLLLKPDEAGEIRLLGGCLCFPSSWRLSDKIGQPIEFIHSPVPGLNASIGAGIHKFLANLKPGVASLRHNWGMTRSPEMNHHPDRKLPRLDATAQESEVWLRVEHQALVALPESGGILFGIRVVNHSLAEVKADAVAKTRLIRALETMPEAMAVYKGIATARSQITKLLGE